MPRCAAQVALIGAYWHSCGRGAARWKGLKVTLVTALPASKWRPLNFTLAAISLTLIFMYQEICWLAGIDQVCVYLLVIESAVCVTGCLFISV